MNIISDGATDLGKKRDNNEDSFIVLDEAGLYVVADGMGGSEGGEVASRIAVETFTSVIPSLLEGKDQTLLADNFLEGEKEFAALRLAVDRANRNIRTERSRHSELAAMGSTLTAFLLKEGRAFLIHVGDSRAYILRSGELRQMSVDHSVVSEYVRAGLLTREEARTSPYRHVITRALGSEDEVFPDTTAQAIRTGDVFLLCTDGLTDMISDGEIAEILAGNVPCKAVQMLIDTANRRGGEDNITAVVVQVKSL
jgi:serine/threonine protein phosphatase PrpC